MAISKGSKLEAADIGSSKIVPKTGGTFTGEITVPSTLISTKASDTEGGDFFLEHCNNSNIDVYMDQYSTLYHGAIGQIKYPFRFKKHVVGNSTETIMWYIDGVSGRNYLPTSSRVTDYAEGHITSISEPGRCLTPSEDGILRPTTKRLEPLCRIISDTYGMAIGMQENNTPIAVMGRVLVYTTQPCENYPLGAAVCSGPNGTVDLMTREEIMEWPDRIVGTVSEIPKEKVWYPDPDDATNEPIYVNGRIWIYIK